MKKTKKIILLIAFFLTVSCIIELIIFNHQAIRTLLGKNKNTIANYYILNENNYSTDEISNLELEKFRSNIIKNRNNIVIIKDINFKVTSLNILYKEKIDSIDTYNPSFTAKGNKYTYYQLEQKVINDGANVYFSFNTKSECYDIKLDINTSAANKEIDKIILNHPNFKFSAVRVIIVFIFLITLYLIKNGKIYKPIVENNKKATYIILILSMFAIIISTIYIYYGLNPERLAQYSYTKDSPYLLDNLNLEVMSIINDEHGKINFSNYNITELYDLAYYNDKYYNYSNNIAIYCILLPFSILTHKYLNIYYLNLILLLLVIIIATIFYILLIEFFIKKINIFNYILGYLTIMLGSNILFAHRIINPDISFLSNFIIILCTLIFILLYLKFNNKLTEKLTLLFVRNIFRTIVI